MAYLYLMRGSQALMALVSNDLNSTSEKHIKGRFKDERDDAIACRFFYYGHLVGKRYDLCLTYISKEFFITELVVGQRLMSRQDFIKQLRISNTSAKDLQKRYPWFNWN